MTYFMKNVMLLVKQRLAPKQIPNLSQTEPLTLNSIINDKEKLIIKKLLLAT